MVGLLTDDSQLVVPEGAQVIGRPETRPPVAMIGHVTSSYYSPNLDRSIALALVVRGGERHGEKVFVAYDGRSVPVTIGPPKFFDPEGERARA